MKKVYVMLGLMLFMFFSVSQINAETQDRENDFKFVDIEKYFSGLKDSDKVLRLPKGGYLYGEATLINADGTKVELNSFEDPNAITVEEYKKMIKEEY